MKSNSKVLIILPTDVIGGAERVAQNLAYYHSNLQSEVSINVYFLTSSKSDSWISSRSHPNITLFYGESKKERSSLLGLYKFLRAHNDFDLVYTTHSHTNALASLLRKLNILRTKKLVTRESTVFADRFFGIKGYLIRSLYKFYGSQNLIICQTTYMKKRLLESVFLPNDLSVQVVQNPINMHSISRLNTDDVELPNSFNIIIVGRLINVKNHKLLIESILKLKNEGVCNFHLHILGDGPEYDYLNNSVNNEGLEGSVTFWGRVDNPYKFMHKADLGVLTSLKEGFPNVLIEMMASGTKNIISTDCAGDLDKLPSVTLMDGFSSDELAYLLKNAIKHRYDYREVYRQYSKSRDVASYWKTIEQFLGD
ncbi:glycosyltransferase [Vibrio parahaemolyticus]|uniref:glycosyltransferase n=1 Tax=Vibrio parahaemolyticus TaxID=670 RepID=UPI002362242A|nr:glycosyltransferase [Vibrio parahaemolyticus]